jgi:hypothetical protein
MAKSKKFNLIAIIAAVGTGFFLLSRRSQAAKLPSTTSPLPIKPLPVSTQINGKAVGVARSEYSIWQGRKETDPTMKPRLIAFWKAAGLSQTDAENAVFERLYWSAAFICFCMRQAGAGSLFAYSVYHTGYCAAAKRNRLANNTKNPFWLFRPSEVAPKVGDLLCNARNNSGLTFDNVDDGNSRASHCDIVVGVSAGRLEVIGGNLDDTVSRRFVRTNANGFVSSSEFYAVLRVGA